MDIRSISSESLQQPDEEEYVYLDSAGLVQKKIELTVTWNSAPDKKMLVTILKTYASPRDTISYLESKIGECMEKFELFEGLTDLRAVHLFNGKQLLPKVLLVKSGDSLWCDLVSKDLWIDVHMNLINAKLTLFFEVKVTNQSLVSEFNRMLVEIANMYLASIYSALYYNLSDLHIDRRESGSGNILQRRKSAQRHRSSELFKPFEGEDTQKIEDCFNFLNRSIRCQLFHRNQGDATLCLTPQKSTDSGSEKLEHFGEYPIRNLRVGTLQRRSILAEILPRDEEVKTRESTCCCGLWA